jgi:hypothetical protein
MSDNKCQVTTNSSSAVTYLLPSALILNVNNLKRMLEAG